MNLNGTTRLIIVVSICVVYIALRLWHLTDSCLWFDEIFSIHAAEHDWKNLFWFVAQDLIHPPLFYVLLKLWIFIGGENLFWLRLFPVVFSILAVIPFLLLCRQLKLSFPTVAIAFAFFAVNGSLIKYAQEVRMYSLLLCFGLFSLWLLTRFVNMGKGFPTLVIINVLLVYTHYFGWLIIASELLAVVILARHRLKMILLMCAAVFLSFTPWIYAIWEASKINSNVGQNIGWMSKPGLTAVFQFIFDLFEPIYFEQSNTDAPAIILITLPIVAVGIIAFGFYFVAWKDESESEKRTFYLLSIFFVTPISLAFAASWVLPYSVWGTRHLIIAFAPFVILTAFAFSKIKFQPIKLIGLAIICLLFVAAFAFQLTRTQPKYIWCAWENLGRNLDVNQPAKIYVFEDLIAYHFWFALRDSDRGFQIIKINDAPGIIEDKAYFLPRGFDGVQMTTDFEGERFFVAYRDKTFNESAPPLQNLKARGYKIGEPQVIEAQGLKAVLIEVWKN
jgi:uncharacterized membrane protein